MKASDRELISRRDKLRRENMIRNAVVLAEGCLKHRDAIGPRVDIRSLAFDCGVTDIVLRPMRVPAVLTREEERWIIAVDSRSPQGPERVRFSIAHERAHLLLRQSPNAPSEGTVALRGGPSSQVESVCDEIAARILMPESAFVSHAGTFGWSLGGVHSLASRFETSITATALRLSKLHPEPCALTFWSLRNMTSWNRLLPAWTVTNDRHTGGRIDIIPRPGMDPLPTVRSAAHTADLATGTEQVREGRRGRVMERYTEARRFGKGDGAFVLTLTHLDKM